MRRTLRILIALWWSFPLAALPQLAMANSTDAIQLRFPGSRPVAPVADGPGRFRLPNLYPGVDAVFYSENSVAEYDFVIAPRADLSKILIGFENAEILKINQSGDIELRSARLYAQIEGRTPTNGFTGARHRSLAATRSQALRLCGLSSPPTTAPSH